MSEQSRRPSEARRRYRIGGGTVASDLDVGRSGGHVDDLIPGYALGALDQLERDAVDRHVRFCERCADLLAEDLRTVGLIPFTMPRATPSPDIKVALFSRIEHAQRAAAQANVPAVAARPLPPTLTIPSSRPANEATPATAEARRSARRIDSRFSWVASALSVPLLVALVASGVWAMQLRGQVGRQAAMVDQLQSQLANFGAGATSYSLSPGATAPQAEGEVIVGADQKSGMVRIDLNSKQPGPASSYEMWVVKDGKLVPATEVQVDDHGVGQAPFQLDQPFSNYESVHVKAKPVATGEAADTTSDDTLLGNIAGTIGSSSSSNYALP